MSDRQTPISHGPAIVTGGGTGIGRETARRLARSGHDVAVLGRRPEPLADTAATIRAEGGVAMDHATDVRDEESVAQTVAAVVDRLGAVAVLVNCAGIPRFASLRRLEMAEYDEVMATNLRGPVVMTRAVLEPMIAGGGGVVVNVSSEVAARGNVSATAYGASKAALNYVTKVWAVELSEVGIRVNAVAPGLTDTVEGVVPQQGMGRDVFLEWMAQRIPMRRPALAEEVAEAVAFLASSAAAYITGAVVAVDGGISAT